MILKITYMILINYKSNYTLNAELYNTVGQNFLNAEIDLTLSFNHLLINIQEFIKKLHFYEVWLYRTQKTMGILLSLLQDAMIKVASKKVHLVPCQSPNKAEETVPEKFSKS